MNLLPSPTKYQEISIMQQLGFMIDNYTIKRVCNLSNDPYIDQELQGHLDAIAKITLARAGVLLHEGSCF